MRYLLVRVDELHCTVFIMVLRSLREEQLRAHLSIKFSVYRAVEIVGRSGHGH